MVLSRRGPVVSSVAEVHMKAVRISYPLLFLALTLAACEPVQPPEASQETATAGPTASAPASVNLAALAGSFVGEAASVREGDLVLITGSSRDQMLLEEMAVQVRRRGAFPMISLANDRLAHRLVAEVPDRYDSQEPNLQLATAEMFDAVIGVAVTEDPDALADIAPERLAAINQAAGPVEAAMLANGVRRVNIGNAMYPTQATAARLGVELETLASMFWGAVFTDPGQLQEKAAVVRQALEAGREVRVTHPNGTDLTFGIQGRPVFVSDGVISSEDEARGGAALSVWLPAGEVFLAPVPGTANGQLVLDRESWEGEEIRGLRMTFEDGQMMAITGESGMEKFQADYAVSSGCRDLFSLLDIGINPGLDSAQLLNWMPAGMVTLGVGSNVWADGDIECEFSFNPHLPGATLTVDGVPIIENGVLR